jgi:ubiquinol-cytochrome c reductase cytochrome c subunit
MNRSLLTAAAFIALATPALAQSTPPGDAARGKVIFMRDACYTCHGTTGASTSFVGPKLAHAGLTAGSIMRQLRHPQAQMPAYTEKVLPDSDVADLAAYIQTLQQGPTPTGKDIPLLNR